MTEVKEIKIELGYDVVKHFQKTKDKSIIYSTKNERLIDALKKLPEKDRKKYIDGFINANNIVTDSIEFVTTESKHDIYSYTGRGEIVTGARYARKKEKIRTDIINIECVKIKFSKKTIKQVSKDLERPKLVDIPEAN